MLSFKKLKVAFRPRKRHLYDANHGIYERQTPAGPVRGAMDGQQKRGLPPSQEAAPKEIFMFNLLFFAYNEVSST